VIFYRGGWEEECRRRGKRGACEGQGRRGEELMQ